MKSPLLSRPVRLLAVVPTLGALSAQAANTPTSINPLEELVITASRTEQRIFDSPASLSVITREDLDRTAAVTLAEMMRDVPGLQVTDSGQPGLGRIRLRGEESRRTAILVNSQEVTDHHEVGTPLTLHPAMVDRIEVIRGSGAVLYGSRALSGVVNFLTRKGGSQPLQATLSASYDGATDGHSVFGSVYGNLEGLEYRLAWSESEHEERETPEGSMENTAFDNSHLYFYTGRTFGDHRLEYTFEDYESSSNVFVEEEVKSTFPLTDFYLETPQRDRNKHGLYWQWDIDSSWVDSLTTSAYRQTSDRLFYTKTDTVWYSREINTDGELTTDGALLQLNLKPWRGHSVIAGLQYLDDEVDQRRHVDTFSWTPPIATTGIEVIEDRASIETSAWFAQDEWEVHDRLTITAGLRQYSVDGDLEYSDRDSLTAGSLADDRELIGALGAVWELRDDLRLRAQAAEGYVYPSLMQLATGAYAGSRFVNPDPDLRPETSMNYELGLRLQRHALVLDATAFYTDSEDYIHHLACEPEDNCPGSRDRLYQNIGESRAHGVELYLAWQGSQLSPYLNLTWMQRRNDYEEFDTWDSGVPLLGGRSGLRWEGATGALGGLWSDLYLRGESSSDLEEPGTTRSVLEAKSGWVTANVAAGIDFGSQQQYQVVVELLNLTDKTYIASTENLYGAQRSASVKLTVDW